MMSFPHEGPSQVVIDSSSLDPKLKIGHILRIINHTISFADQMNSTENFFCGDSAFFDKIQFGKFFTKTHSTFQDSIEKHIDSEIPILFCLADPSFIPLVRKKCPGTTLFWVVPLNFPLKQLDFTVEKICYYALEFIIYRPEVKWYFLTKLSFHVKEIQKDLQEKSWTSLEDFLRQRQKNGDLPHVKTFTALFQDAIQELDESLEKEIAEFLSVLRQTERVLINFEAIHIESVTRQEVAAKLDELIAQRIEPTKMVLQLSRWIEDQMIIMGEEITPSKSKSLFNWSVSQIAHIKEDGTHYAYNADFTLLERRPEIPKMREIPSRFNIFMSSCYGRIFCILLLMITVWFFFR